MVQLTLLMRQVSACEHYDFNAIACSPVHRDIRFRYLSQPLYNVSAGVYGVAFTFHDEIPIILFNQEILSRVTLRLVCLFCRNVLRRGCCISVHVNEKFELKYAMKLIV